MSATITFLLLFSFTLSTCVDPSASPATALLDVASSLQQTLDVLSVDSQTLNVLSVDPQTLDSAFNSSASFSLPLLSRQFIFKTQNKDYKTLLLSRLERDSFRVNYLVTKLQPQLDDLSTPVISGRRQGSGEYFSRIGVGSPPKQFYMVLDTGSDINWLQCKPCGNCYEQVDPIYDPVASSSYRSLSCDSPQCTALGLSNCRSSKCQYQVSYGDGSFTVGDFVAETVTFGNSARSIQNVAIGCGHNHEGLFVGAAGLLGLGGGSLSFPNQIKAASFSYCLVDRYSAGSGSLQFNSPLSGDSVIAPMIRSRNIDAYYYVGLTGFSVGGKVVAIPPSLFQLDSSGNGGIILDSGTSVTRLQTQAYDLLRDSFRALATNLKSTTGFMLFDTCYDLSTLSSVKVPTMSFNFAGGKSLVLPPNNYLIPVDSTGTFCFAFAPTKSSFGIIGNIQQQGTGVTYDLANNCVGFSPNKC